MFQQKGRQKASPPTKEKKNSKFQLTLFASAKPDVRRQ